MLDLFTRRWCFKDDGDIYKYIFKVLTAKCQHSKEKASHQAKPLNLLTNKAPVGFTRLQIQPPIELPKSELTRPTPNGHLNTFGHTYSWGAGQVHS